MSDWKLELGQQIRENRKDRFWNQQDLCQRASVHVNSISRYETGQAAPELDVLLRLAAALDMGEFRIGDQVISIQAIADSKEEPAGPKQLRLEYGKEYVFDGGDSLMKIHPSKAGLVITPEKRTA